MSKDHKSKDHKKPVDIDLTTPDSPSPDLAEAAAPAAPGPEVAAPTTTAERVALLESEKAELKDRMLRIAADFDNYKKRARRDQADGEARAKESVLRDFLEVTDNLERATASWGKGKDDKEAEAKSIREGVDLVLRQFRTKLERYQVKIVESLGQPFDPRFHEAISQAPSADAQPGTVIHELQKGYTIGDKLLRPAMVVVAVAPPPPAADKPTEAASEAKASSGNSEGED
jgi:molecular chaperone GrpE